MALTSRPFEAGYDTECPDCGEIIEPGDIAQYCSEYPELPICAECADRCEARSEL